jgi:hypothetical protein
LLARSAHAPELPGLREITGKKLEHEPLVKVWTAEIAARLRLQLAKAGLTELELDAARTLTLEKYSGFAWTERR